MDAFRTTDMIWKEKSCAFIMEYTVKYCIKWHHLISDDKGRECD